LARDRAKCDGGSAFKQHHSSPYGNRNYVDHVQITAAETVAWSIAAVLRDRRGAAATWCPIIFFTVDHDRDGAADFVLMPMK